MRIIVLLISHSVFTPGRSQKLKAVWMLITTFQAERWELFSEASQTLSKMYSAWFVAKKEEEGESGCRKSMFGRIGELAG